MNDFVVGLLILVIYLFFAIRWGVSFVDGRFEWLEQPNHKIIKIVVAAILGYFVVGLYFIFWCVKMIVVVLPKWLS